MLKTYIKKEKIDGEFHIKEKNFFKGWQTIYSNKKESKVDEKIIKLSRCDDTFIVE